MYRINEDNSIYATRGDIVVISLTADDNGKPYTFQVGEVLRIKVFGKKDAESVALQKDFPVTAVTQTMQLFLDENDTKIGEVISKPKDYWYEIELNPFDNPQTIIGYDEDGPKIFKLLPEGADIPPYVPDPEDIPVIDNELDMTSDRPVANQVVARAFFNLQAGYQATHEAVSKLHITPQMYGAVGDGKADDTEAIKTAISAIGKNGISTLHFPTGTYLVSEDIPLVSNMTITGDGYNSVIKRAGTEETNYNVLRCDKVANVTIRNIHIQGERSEHKGENGEWGMCLGLLGSSAVTIEDCKLTDGWGDGVYIGCDNTGKGCSNITIDNCIIDHNRRNGVSVIECDGFRLLNSRLTNTDGTAPKAGIDFEPNETDQVITNCIVDNCIFYGNYSDIMFYDRSSVQAVIRNCHTSSTFGFRYDSVELTEKADGSITVHNCDFMNSQNCCVFNRKHINSVPVRFVGCVMASDVVAIQVGGSNINYQNKMGDIHFIDCYVAKSTHNTGWFRYQNSGNYPLEKVTLAVRLGDGVPYRMIYSNVNDCQYYADIKCIPRTYKVATMELNKYNTEPYICLDTEDYDCVITLKSNIALGLPIRIRKLNTQNKVTIINDTETFPCPNDNGDYTTTINITGRFDEITLIRDTQGSWRIVDTTVKGVS